MKGEVWLRQLGTHERVINNHAARINETRGAVAYSSTRQRALEAALTESRFSLVKVLLRENFRLPGRPSPLIAELDDRQKVLLAVAQAPKKPAVPAPSSTTVTVTDPGKIEIKELTPNA